MEESEEGEGDSGKKTFDLLEAHNVKFSKIEECILGTMEVKRKKIY